MRTPSLSRVLITAAAIAAASPGSSQAQAVDSITSGIADVLRFAGVQNPPAGDVARMADAWTRAQRREGTTEERRAAFRELFGVYSRLQGGDSAAPGIDARATFATTLAAAGGRMDLSLGAGRGKPEGRYLGVETRGRGTTRLLMISDVGIDGRRLYQSFADRHAETYTTDIVTLPFAGAARPLPWPEHHDFTARPWLTHVESELLQLLDRASMDDVVVVGTAAGGYLAARLALLRPAKVRGVALVNALVKTPMAAPGNPGTDASPGQRHRAVRVVPFAPQLWPLIEMPRPAEVRRLLAAPSSSHPIVQNWFAFAVRDTSVSRVWTFDALTGGYFLPASQYSFELSSTDLTPDLQGLRVPMLAIASRHDSQSPVRVFPATTQWEQVKRLYPSIPLSTAVLDSVRAYVSVDAPSEFDRLIVGFLSRLSSEPD